MSRRDDSRRRRDHRSSSSSPGPSRESSSTPRDYRELPVSFGRIDTDTIRVDDELSVIQRMESSYKGSPLHFLYNYLADEIPVKVFTRNHKDVRGCVSGYIVVFDKHWNIILRDCSDVFHKPRKSKTPFLRNVNANESLPDMPAKEPKKKAEGKQTPDADPPKPAEKEGKKKKAKKSKTKVETRKLKKIFIRGDNVVMVTPDPTLKQECEEEDKAEPKVEES